MSLFDKLLKLRHEQLNSNRVMKEISSFLANEHKIYKYEDNGVTLLFAHAVIPGFFGSYRKVTGFVYNNQYIAHITFDQFYEGNDTCIYIGNFTYHKLSAGVPVSAPTISEHEKIVLPDATFNMFLPRCVKSANKFTSKIID